jgi:hypothetical protein
MYRPTILAQEHSDWIPGAVAVLSQARGKAIAEMLGELGPKVVSVIDADTVVIEIVNVPEQQNTAVPEAIRKVG